MKSRQEIQWYKDSERLTYLKNKALSDLHIEHKRYLLRGVEDIHREYQELMHAVYLRFKQPILIHTKYGILFG